MKLSVKPRRIKGQIPPIDRSIQFDDARRLRNALLAMALTDPGWMYWVERNLARTLSLPVRRRLVERRARVLVVRNYRFLGWGAQLSVIYSDYYFQDDGHLKTYL